ncbi:PAS domain-containing protein [Rhodocytophaga rosea]|uniref:histidine kinase n=1 Tax=Rhodocytophaga rosea TaxID=2704465 RepID=A0A6C0GRS3_9BACT|nr:chemotaxis protein CheB [Rhodocytophaga rosea]QHT70303.1 PAS domain-containing protein [Rhodocytophaga rosea]
MMKKDASAAVQTASGSGSGWQDAYVIGIGASAGGLEALHEFFDNMPADTHFSFVIVQHLSPDYKSLLVELLSKHTQMKVAEAEDGTLLMPNCVYVIPSRKLMTLKNGKIRLTEKRAADVPNTAVDIFLQSLAKEKGDKAIAIILSGTGTDGTKGIETIKKSGGIVIVQDPLTAKFDGMPNSAIISGHSDLILPPEMMPEEIFKFIKQGRLLKYFEHNEMDEEESCLAEILLLIKNTTQYDFTSYKPHTIKRRIMRRLVYYELDSLQQYLSFLKQHPGEAEILSKDFLIGVTKFFRDGQAFDVIRKKVLPAIIDKKEPGDQLKIWVAACSTGEEAYTLAILVKEHLDHLNKDLNVKIFATDVDKEAVEIAARGIYNPNIAKDISEERLENFFTQEGGKYIINQHIRKMVIFAHHNVIKDPPYSKIDLVSCRNMLIYMSPSLQRKILTTFHFSLNVGGYLMLGSSENPGELSSELSEVSRKWKIYQSIRASRNFTFDSYLPPLARDKRELATITPTLALSRQSMINKMMDVFSDALIEESGYAGIFISEEYELIQAVGEYKKYLKLPEKRLQFNLLKMVPEDLSVPLGVAIRRAVKNNDKVIVKNVRWKEKSKIRFISIIVKPFVLSKDSSQKGILVLFNEEKVQQSSVGESENPNKPAADIEYFREVEQELKETKVHLNAAVEELETSNEELQSSNEELLSSNEELQSTNEELQSLNEELHTVNTEHQLKIKELIELNDDLNNYFRSTDIGQIFIDKSLIIRKYTPAIINQINIIESDVGRPIHHFSNNIKYDRLIEDIRQVIATSDSIEKEVELRDGRYYLMKMLPYIRLDKRTDGVVITFVDVTALKNLNLIVSGVLNSSLNGIMGFKSIRSQANEIVDFEWTLTNDASRQLLGREKNDLIGKRLLREMPGNRDEGLFDKYTDVVETGKPLHIEHYYEQDGLKLWLEIIAIKMEDGIAVTFADISEKKRAEEKLLRAYEDVKKAEENLKKLNNELEKRVAKRTQELSASEERFRLISLATNDVIWDWNLVSNELWWNEGFKTMFGYSEVRIEKGIESWYNRLHPEEKERVIQGIDQVLNSGHKQWSDEYRFLRADGSYAFIFGRGYVLHNEYGIPYRMLGSFIDLTSQRKMQEELEVTNQNLLRINNDLDNFIYTASHDLKAPIINLEGLVKNLNKKLQTDNEELSFILDLMRTTIDKFKNTINDLTDISRIQKSDQDDIEWINLYELSEDIFVNIRDMIVGSGANIRLDFEECLQVKFSRKNLYSVLYNLLSNAVKYRSSERQLLVQVKSTKVDDFVLITVEDNGLGISEDNIPNLFNMFKRFHDHVDGSGVGLYIVKRIIENAGGSIEVESQPDKGTIFKVFLKIGQ